MRSDERLLQRRIWFGGGIDVDCGGARAGEQEFLRGCYGEDVGRVCIVDGMRGEVLFRLWRELDILDANASVGYDLLIRLHLIRPRSTHHVHEGEFREGGRVRRILKASGQISILVTAIFFSPDRLWRLVGLWGGCLQC